ncbi:MAG: RNA pseudouridine synthase, partial [Saprospiraceae bacterium]|nr:RNA pseudouridine synthase [Saprospiraceae bacterium]
MKVELIFEDDDLILVNKPADMLTIPDRFDASKPSIYGELTKHFGKVFIVHRLDRETSGILVFAKN